MDYTYLIPQLIPSSLIQMLIGEGAQIREDLYLDIVYTLEIIWSLGLQNDNQFYPALVLKQSIEVLLMLLLNLDGFETYY